MTRRRSCAVPYGFDSTQMELFTFQILQVNPDKPMTPAAAAADVICFGI